MKSKKPTKSQLRLRVFAGPNGSGKSTVIKSIRESEVSGRQIDFGVYINADDIARELTEDIFSFKSYDLNPDANFFFDFANGSGLIKKEFTLAQLQAAVSFEGQVLKLENVRALDQVAQIIARFLRQALFEERRRFSFETVFSHESNLEIMEKAAAAGYKVYLYFVSTESPVINQYRVSLRKKKGGHDVPPGKIVSRYYSSLELLYRASQIAYQAFFFDNSFNEEPFRLIGHFKITDSVKVWDTVVPDTQTAWFKKYYLTKALENEDSVPLAE